MDQKKKTKRRQYKCHGSGNVCDDGFTTGTYYYAAAASAPTHPPPALWERDCECVRGWLTTHDHLDCMDAWYSAWMIYRVGYEKTLEREIECG